MPNKKVSKAKKILLVSLSTFIILIVISVIYFKSAVTIEPPSINDFSPLKLERITTGQDSYTCGKNWLRKNKWGLWELYVEGKPFERGVIIGKLTKELIQHQENAFVHQLNALVPSKIYLGGLRLFIAWFNRNLDSYINEEYKQEIFGISKSASNEYEYIASNYQRILNYHAAHDIGHALQGMNMVGCTSFSAWDTKTDDGNLLVGRNFDFYVGDEFAQDKIVCFLNPSNGYKLMMVTWGGMIGVVSGMNEKGLTVTLNAAKSEIPTSAATPISIVAREILQYAKNINEAYAIAAKRKTFVSESIMIGSLEDNKTVIIEKTPTKTALYSSENNFIICSNHYQSNSFKNDKLNVENKNESSSLYRYNHVLELMNKFHQISYLNAADILRNKKGLADKNIGLGNEKSINQLIAHHSIIFNPAKKIVWVSTNPFQLGEYIAYDLTKIFSTTDMINRNGIINENSLTIPADPFLSSTDYQNFLKFKRIKKTISDNLQTDNNIAIKDDLINEFIISNPEYYEVYSLLGIYYQKHGDLSKAIKFYKTSLTKEISSLTEENKIKKKLSECYK